ncbi:VC0807 family protein [Actinospica robiniae]|uniref:VC0807 family protein n=1 Tax=Actinospica robiniae TaxID=304901 RepID=UPI00040431FE|nr:VC0807 family protein [Actinospica robiniae]
MHTVTATRRPTATEATAEQTTGGATARRPAATDPRSAFAPLLVDVAVPLGTYYVAHSALGLSTAAALIVSSLIPAARTLAGLFGKHERNALATLMLVVNLVGIALTFATGDARLMLAKDSAISSVIGIGMLASVFGRKPLMSAALKPMLTKGDPAKDAAWDQLTAGSARFRRNERAFTLIWGTCLLTDCVVRFIGAFTLPVATMTWLGTVILVGAILLAIALSGHASKTIEKLVDEAAIAASASASAA